LLELALSYQDDDSVVSAKEIAARQEISLKYLEQLLAALQAAGLVRSVRGTRGGHSLARPPAEISVREIYHAFEGTEGFAECTACPELCDRTDTCATQPTWDRMYAASMKVLESTTLEDLARRARNVAQG
jgi:Rrf2 family protein